MDWLVDAVASRTIWNTSQRRRRKEANGTWDNGRLVRDDVSEKVGSDDNAVQSRWTRDHQHGCGIDEVVAELELWVLLLEDLSDDLAP